MFSPCSEKRRASDKDLPVQTNQIPRLSSILLAVRGKKANQRFRGFFALNGLSVPNLLSLFLCCILQKRESNKNSTGKS